ncbi:hypothetical protein CEXT_625911 [Caerostris extrusa]|uniref:Uncharacterized protein n=1 Tax=Caerostris extrusa TaxID=172846 RepID=A0AAV4WSS2_CAEEX|nr:hypothetical protein CEXT_625911 [Caerostris extrusa]
MGQIENQGHQALFDDGCIYVYISDRTSTLKANKKALIKSHFESCRYAKSIDAAAHIVLNKTELGKIYIRERAFALISLPCAHILSPFAAVIIQLFISLSATAESLSLRHG